MPVRLSGYTDEQLKTFLSRVLSRHLIALMTSLSSEDRSRILNLVSNHSAKLISQAMDDSPQGQASTAERILREAAAQSQSCTFCRIFDGELPGSFVYSDEQLAIIMDLHPVTPGHSLIIPREHEEFITDLDREVAASMMNKAQSLGKVVTQSELGADGFNLHLANRGAANQDVFHVHLHVIPRYFGDRFGFRFPPGYPKEAARPDLDSQALMLQESFSLLQM